MKKLILGLMCLIGTFTYSQVKYPIIVEGDTINIVRLHPDYEVPFHEFILWSKEYGLPLDRFKYLDGIAKSYDMHLRGALGVWLEYPGAKDLIMISSTIPRYLPTVKEMVVFHELTHFYLEYHGHCDTKECPYIFQSGGNINEEHALCKWGEYKKELMLFIKKEYEQRTSN